MPHDQLTITAPGDSGNEIMPNGHKENGQAQCCAQWEADKPPIDVEALFYTLAQKWVQETGMLSNLKESYMNPNYQQIIGLGPDVVPVILRELRNYPNHWFWALRAITRVNPAPVESAGKTQLIAKAWLRWGEKKGSHAE